mmetsp:Transcript_11101/g.28673  ORF Transcript_11101/g.28673 Transcript_11101/m.28673 type:complete len:245 (+) Transcript_11101:10-744(+)|eukprot:858042-Prymnesium_polylepis.1
MAVLGGVEPAALGLPSVAGEHAEGAAASAWDAAEGSDGDEDWDEDWDEAWQHVQDDYAAGAGMGSKSDALAGKFESLVKLEKLSGSARDAGLSQAAGNSLSRTERKLDQAKHHGLTRDERATTDQVLDPRTRMILFKMMNTGSIESINGCVSTGKEANVYHAFGPECELAVKVYKTSILIFKDRDRYVSGEFRFRHGYCKSNPRKMVKMWAEKEMRNYRRLHLAKVCRRRGGLNRGEGDAASHV